MYVSCAIMIPCKWGNTPSVSRNLDTATCLASDRVRPWWSRFSCRLQSAPRPDRAIGRLCRRYRSCGMESRREWGSFDGFWGLGAYKAREINEPLPPAVAILRRDRYNWAPRGCRFGHRGCVRGTPEGRRIVVCIRDGDRYCRCGWELRLRVNFLSNHLITAITARARLFFTWRNKGGSYVSLLAIIRDKGRFRDLSVLIICTRVQTSFISGKLWITKIFFSIFLNG